MQPATSPRATALSPGRTPAHAYGYSLSGEALGATPRSKPARSGRGRNKGSAEAARRESSSRRTHASRQDRRLEQLLEEARHPSAQSSPSPSPSQQQRGTSPMTPTGALAKYCWG